MSGGHGPFESFTGELARGVYAQFCSNCDFRGGMVQNIGCCVFG
jgi:hypothetical protein